MQYTKLTVVVADDREKQGAIPHLPGQIFENTEFAIKRLTIGDYQILVRMQNAEGDDYYAVAMIFERKTWSDFAASIKDGRDKGQTSDFISYGKKYGCRTSYIIEGANRYKDTFKIGNIEFSKLHAKLRHNYIRGIDVWHTKDDGDTARLLALFANDLVKMRDELSFSVQIPSHIAGGSEAIMEASTPKKRPIDLIREDIWRVLEAGPMAAVILNEKYKLGEILSATPEKRNTMHREVATIQYPGGKAFGDILAAKIVRAPDEKTSAAILSKINGISESAAAAILAKYKLEDIAAGRITVTQLENVFITDKRRLGPAKAEKIREIFSY